MGIETLAAISIGTSLVGGGVSAMGAAKTASMRMRRRRTIRPRLRRIIRFSPGDMRTCQPSGEIFSRNCRITKPVRPSAPPALASRRRGWM
jgi:hypothetical protein